jgi:hypothetical protein
MKCFNILRTVVIRCTDCFNVKNVEGLYKLLMFIFVIIKIHGVSSLSSISRSVFVVQKEHIFCERKSEYLNVI